MTYADEDLEVADRIHHSALQRFDSATREEFKFEGDADRYQLEVREKIEASDLIVAVISENSFKSLAAQMELSIVGFQLIGAPGKSIFVIPIDKSPIPSYLAGAQIVDLSEDFEAGLVRLGTLLQQAVHRIQFAEIARIQEAPQDTDRSNTEVEDIRTENRRAARADNRKAKIAVLRDALRAGRLTLVCGAGVSVEAGIPAWKNLLVTLLKRMMTKLAATHAINAAELTNEGLESFTTTSPLIVGKYLKNYLKDDFVAAVRDALYDSNPQTCPLVEAVAQLSRPKRDGRALDSIITFNFDGLVEGRLDILGVPAKAIFSESISHDANFLPIYHVHGFLPRNGEIPTSSAVVFAEDAYHTQFLDPFSWSNLIQLNDYRLKAGRLGCDWKSPDCG